MRTAAVIQKMKERKYDALDEMIDIAETAKKTGDLETRLEVAKTLLPYVYPKLKHIEVDAQVNHGITVHVRQFVKPATAIEEENERLRLSGDSEPSESDRIDEAIRAQLPVGLGGHPDIIPDPFIPEKRKKV
jgi:hypothetical protein